MIEIAVAAQAAFKAYSLIKSGVEGGKEIEDMGKTVARWFQAKDDLDVAIKQEEQRKGQAAKDANTDPLAGSVWAEAAEYVEEQRRTERQLEKIKWMYIDAGKSAEWARVKTKAASLQKQRDADIRKKKEKETEDNLLLKQVMTIFGVLFGGLVVVGVILFLVFGLNSE
tara:strand:- start:550 stop:1056 length:507 start_codon:yes stop_codon:yes gene_type:complete